MDDVILGDWIYFFVIMSITGLLLGLTVSALKDWAGF